MIYLQSECRISVHPADVTGKRQASREWRGTRGRGKSEEQHRGIHDGRTERQERFTKYFSFPKHIVSSNILKRDILYINIYAHLAFSIIFLIILDSDF